MVLFTAGDIKWVETVIAIIWKQHERNFPVEEWILIFDITRYENYQFFWKWRKAKRTVFSKKFGNMNWNVQDLQLNEKNQEEQGPKRSKQTNESYKKEDKEVL